MKVREIFETAAGGAIGAGSIAGFRGSFFGNGRNQDLRPLLDKKLKRMGFYYVENKKKD